jgi:septum formation protein
VDRPSQPDPLILASTSPRRAQLLREAGYRFTAVAPPSQEPEEPHPHVDPAAHAESLAYYKARSIAKTNPRDTILAADTISVFGVEVFGKPDDREDARRILRKLRGTSHQVITGLALMHPETDKRLLGHAVSTVRMRPIADDDLEAYLDGGAWRGKAGAYGIQDQGDPFVEAYEGSFSNIVGLPLELLREMLVRWK